MLGRLLLKRRQQLLLRLLSIQFGDAVLNTNKNYLMQISQTELPQKRNYST